MKVTKSRLKQIIKEEISIGFGQGKSPGDELNKKQVVYLEADGEEALAAIKDVPAAAQNIAEKMRAEIERMAEPSGLDPAVLLQAVAALLTAN